MTERAARVRLLCLDVDGVMTDGSVSLDCNGEETKTFNVRDGLGISLWLRLGGQVAVITGRPIGGSLRRRLEELRITHAYGGSKDKRADLAAAAAACAVSPEETAFVGDDLPDLPAMRACGYPVAVQDAAPEVRASACLVTAAPGGRGAVREVVEHLLRSQRRWNEAMAMFDGPSLDPAEPGGGHDRPRSA